MRKIIFILVLMLASFLQASAQNIFSDSLQISLLTCGQGPDAYERFGHTAVRVTDLKNKQLDIVFHYGVFSFKTPNFVWRFVKGETDYQLGAVDYNRFYNEYKERGLLMYEQKLALDSAQTASIVTRLIINYQPENRVYRYNYFFDNCATRPFHLINDACRNAITYDTFWIENTTYRQMVREKTHPGTWLDFGITLAIGTGADKPIGLQQQVFLPDYLATAYDHASLDGHQLVAQTDTLLLTRNDVQQTIDARPGLFDPLPVMTMALLIGVVLLAFRIKQNKPGGKHERTARLLSNIFDTLFLFSTGIAATIIWFLLLGSEHPTVNENLNCAWLWPTNIIFCLLIWLKSAQKVQHIYFLTNFAALIAFYMCVTSGWQESSPEVLLLAATAIFRTLERSFFNQKEEANNENQ